MRSFIAIRLEDNIKNALTATQNELERRGFHGHYTNMANMHLTLAFIGEYNDPDAILEAMGQMRFEPFPLTLSGFIGNFGDLLWAGIEKEPMLEKCVKQLRHTLADRQIPFDKKRFAPHITLLRNAKSKQTFADIKIAKESMIVSRISLMRSDIGKRGAVYTEIGSIDAIT